MDHPLFVHNASIRIHYLEQGAPNPLKPSFLVSAGIWEPAERALPLFNRLDWPHKVSFSYRGRGLSDTPHSGYELEDHLTDLEAVVSQTRLQKIVLLGFSRGVACAVQFTLNHPDLVAGLILVDYPPIQFRWEPGAAEFWKKRIYLGKPFTDFIRPHAIEQLETEAREVVFWDRLPEIRCPVWIFRGLDLANPIPPNLSTEDSQRYQRLLPQVQEIGFEHSGHMLADDEPDRYAAVIQQILNTY